jgi:hypothetical protein
MEKIHVRTSATPTPQASHPDPRALKILAKSIFKELRAQGYSPQQVLSLATEIIALVTSDIAHDTDSTSR